MARLFEYQSKELLKNSKINVPVGKVVSSQAEAETFFDHIGRPVMVKAQTWTTGRKEAGGIKSAENKEALKEAVTEIIGKKIKGFEITQVLVEEKLPITAEYFAGITIDDNSKTPVLIFSSQGGTGIEEIAKNYPDKLIKYPVPILEGIKEYQARELARQIGFKGALQVEIASFLVKLYNLCRKYEARSAEVNPLVLTKDGKIYAADCHIAIDDYAVFRHSDLNIEIARELSNPPTKLDKIAFNVEKNDYRGTFYFIQLETGYKKGDGYIGFHGAGGGGSMMSMDAVLSRGFKIANFCDTSGNPPASKVYRAARIILAQKGIDAYFGSGSGVASQEQFHSARGLMKAFKELDIELPVVVRLGGNMEEKAIEIINRGAKDLRVPVECYGKDTPATYCAERLRKFVDELNPLPAKPKKAEQTEVSYSFKTVTNGEVKFDYTKCRECSSKACVKECIPQILKIENDVPQLAITPEEAAKGKCIECLACECECEYQGLGGVAIHLPIAGLDEYLSSSKAEV